MIRIAVIPCTTTGNLHRFAEAVTDGARDQGAEVGGRAAQHQGARLVRYAAAIRSLRREPALVDV